MADLLEQAFEAENASPQLVRLFRSIYQQESSSGKNIATSESGAVGPAQILPATFNSVADRDWNIKNKFHNLRAGIRYLNQGLEASNGDDALAAAYYYSGPGGAAKAARGIPVSVPGQPKAPTQLQYAQQVTARIGSSGISDWQEMLAQAAGKPAPEAAQTPEDKLMAQWDKFSDQTQRSAAASLASTPAVSQPQERTFAQKAGRIALETAGAVGGAFATPYAPPIGAGLGAAAASYTASKTFDPVDNADREAFWAGVFGLGGQAVGSVFGRLLAPSKIRAGGPELLRITQTAGLRPPLPAQYFESKGTDMLMNIGKTSAGGANAIVEAEIAATTAARTAATDYAEALAQSKAAGWTIMEYVISRAQGKVPTIETLDAAKAMAARYPGNTALGDLVKTLERQPVRDIPFNVTNVQAVQAQELARKYAAAGVTARPKLEGAQDIISQLKLALRDAKSGTEAADLELVIGRLQTAMEKSLAATNPNLKGLWEAGRTIYRQGIQGDEITKMLNTSIKSGGQAGEIEGNLLMNKLKPEALKSLGTSLEPGQVQKLRDLALALQASTGPRDKALSFISNGVQVSAVLKLMSRTAEIGGAALSGGAVATGNLPGLAGATALALTPSMIGRIVASPRTFKLMLTLSKLPAESKAATQVMAQLLSQMANEGIITPDQSQGR